MLIHFSNNFSSGRRFVYEAGGVDRGGSAGGRDGENGEDEKVAKKRRERIAGFEDLDALGLLDEGQTEELAALRQAEAAAKAAKEKIDRARTALVGTEKAGKPAPAPAYKPGSRRIGGAETDAEEPEPEVNDGLEVSRVDAGSDTLESIREEIEDMVYYYREGNDNATTEGLIAVLADSYGVSPDKLRAGGITLKSSDRAISRAAIKALAADDTGQG